jgi:hypothetical protein
MAQSPELQSKIAIWRAKSADGTITTEELREAIRELRAGRISAGEAARSTRKRAIAEIPSADDMLKELEGL